MLPVFDKTVEVHRCHFQNLSEYFILQVIHQATILHRFLKGGDMLFSSVFIIVRSVSLGCGVIG